MKDYIYLFLDSRTQSDITNRVAALDTIQDPEKFIQTILKVLRERSPLFARLKVWLEKEIMAGTNSSIWKNVEYIKAFVDKYWDDFNPVDLDTMK